MLGGEAQAMVKNGQPQQVWTRERGLHLGAMDTPYCPITAWFNMNNITDARSLFTAQATIFKNEHNWLMCVLYLGTFGSFIGFAAGFPLLMEGAVPNVNPLAYAWLGPLVGAVITALWWLAGRQARRWRGHAVELYRHGASP